MKKEKTKLPIIIFFIAIFLFLAFAISFTEFFCTDFIWNFQSIFKMHQGNLIYKDFNVIITPLFFYIGNLMFHLFGANLNVFQFYGIIIYFLKLVLLFCIFRSLKIKRFLSVLYTSLWLILELPYISNSANYNQLALLFCLIGILYYILNDTKKYYHFVQGILIFLVFFTKQTTGIYYAFGIVLFESIQSRFDKNFFQKQFIKFLTFLVCILTACCIFYIRGNFFNFINLCFGSILEFGSSNTIFIWSNLKQLFMILFILAFSIFVLTLKNIAINIKKQISFLLVFSLAMSFNMFPLVNPYHINMAMLFYYILFIYIINQLLINEIFTTNLHKKICIIICIFIFSFLFVQIGYSYFTEYINLERFNKNHPFYNIGISAENMKKLENMTNYIQTQIVQGIRVIILCYEAASYMIPLNINNGDFDLPYSGNLGYAGIQNMIEKISKMENTEFLIFTNEEDCFYQESREIREYILNHLEKKGELFKYSIYIKE